MISLVRMLARILGRGAERVTRAPHVASPWEQYVTSPAARFWVNHEGHEYVIDRSVLAGELKKRLEERGDTLGHELHRVMQDWSDPNFAQAGLVVDLPCRWRSFDAIAVELIEQGQGLCLCRDCGRVYPAKDLTVRSYRFGAECVTARTDVQCPAFHEILRSEMRVRVRVDRLPSGAAR